MGAKQSKSNIWSLQRLNCLDMPSSDSDDTSTRSANGNDEECIAEYACAVLQSKRWEAEVMSFVDEHCIVFVDDEGNKIEHTRLHGEYTDLVTKVLRQRLSEVGITKDEFASACGPSSSLFDSRRMKKSAIEQLAAKDDFAIFKQLMSRRNMELERELREVLEKKEKEAAGTQQSQGEATCERLPLDNDKEKVSTDDEGDSSEDGQTTQPSQPKDNAPEFLIKQEDLDSYGYVEDEQLRLLFAATNKILASPEGKSPAVDDTPKAAAAAQREAENTKTEEVEKEDNRQAREAHLRNQRDLLVAKKKAERARLLESGSTGSPQPRSLTGTRLPSLSPPRM